MGTDPRAHVLRLAVGLASLSVANGDCTHSLTKARASIYLDGIQQELVSAYSGVFVPPAKNSQPPARTQISMIRDLIQRTA